MKLRTIGSDADSRWIQVTNVRSDEAALIISHMRLLILLMMTDGPHKLPQEQTSKGQSLGNDMGEGAATEWMRNAVTPGMSSKEVQVVHLHDTLTYLVQHDAVTINCRHRGRTKINPTKRAQGTRKDAGQICAKSRRDRSLLETRWLRHWNTRWCDGSTDDQLPCSEHQ